MDKVEQIPTQQVFGIAKKMTLELEKYPLHSHAGIVTMMRTMVEHRKIVLENEMQAEQIKANEEAMAAARKAHADAQLVREAEQAEKDRRNAERLKSALIELPKPRAELPAEPELVTAG